MPSSPPGHCRLAAQSAREGLRAPPTCQTGCPNGAWVRTTRVVIGDGVSTNEAACKLLFALLREKAPAHNYNVLVFRCATHQAKLVVKTAA